MIEFLDRHFFGCCVMFILLLVTASNMFCNLRRALRDRGKKQADEVNHAER